MTKPAIGIAAVVMAVMVSVAPSGAQPVGLAPTVRTLTPPSELRTYPVFDPLGAPAGDATWRVVESTGNCCENYLAMTAKGRLLDLGGTYLNFSDDAGQTWKQLRPLDPLVGGEGAVTAAPGGDVVGVGWDVYGGDHLQSYKFDGKSGEWSYSEVPIHSPFFDRPWIAAVPGPFTIGPVTAPYLVVLKGGWPFKEVLYYSLDGLNYVAAGSQTLERLGSPTVTEALKTSPDPNADFYQPNTRGGITPVPGVGAVGTGALLGGRALMRAPNVRWMGHTFPGVDTAASGRLLVDSAGRLHRVAFGEEGTTFTYEISSDGGGTWQETKVALPTGLSTWEWDFKANGALGLSVIGLQAATESVTSDRFLAYAFETATGTPRLVKIYQVGDGDLAARGDLLGGGARFDFNNVVIFPDGRIATSFKDKAHTQRRPSTSPGSSIAILQEPVPLTTATPPPKRKRIRH